MLENYNWEKDNYGDLSPLKEKTSTFWISDIHRIMMQNKSQWDLKRFQEKKQTSQQLEVYGTLKQTTDG